MFEVNERVRCVSNAWEASEGVERDFLLDHKPIIGREYTVRGYVSPGEYPYGSDAIIARVPMVTLWELASPLDMAGCDGFPAHWFRRAVKLDTSAGMATLKKLTTNPRVLIPADEKSA